MLHPVRYPQKSYNKQFSVKVGIYIRTDYTLIITTDIHSWLILNFSTNETKFNGF